MLINVHPVCVSRAPDRARWRMASSWRAALKPAQPTRRPSGAGGPAGSRSLPHGSDGMMAMARDYVGALVPAGQMAVPAGRDGRVVARADNAGAVERGPIRQLPARIWQVLGWGVREHSGSMLALGPHAHKKRALAKGGVPGAFLPALGFRHGRWASKSWRALIPSDAMLSRSWLRRSRRYMSQFRPTANDPMRKRCKAQSGNSCPWNALASGVRSSSRPRPRAEPPTLSPAPNGPDLVPAGEVPAPATIRGRISP